MTDKLPKLPRMAAIHDLSGLGKCSLTVALPIVSASGVECCCIPTALLSTHTGGFADWTFTDLSDANVPESVYDTLIETVREFMPLMYRYVALRKRMLQVDELHMYDLYTPIVPESSRKVSFEEAKELVLRALSPMGEEYLDALGGRVRPLVKLAGQVFHGKDGGGPGEIGFLSGGVHLGLRKYRGDGGIKQFPGNALGIVPVQNANLL